MSELVSDAEIQEWKQRDWSDSVGAWNEINRLLRTRLALTEALEEILRRCFIETKDGRAFYRTGPFQEEAVLNARQLLSTIHATEGEE